MVLESQQLLLLEHSIMRSVVLGMVVGYFLNTKEGRQYLSSGIEFIKDKLIDYGAKNERRINEIDEDDSERIEIIEASKTSSTLS